MQTSEFCWMDMGSPDPEKTTTFYASLFNWSFDDHKMADGSSYWMGKSGEHGIGGIYQLKDPNQRAGWLNYVLVDNADEMVEKSTSLGGTTIQAPFDVQTYGRMAICQSPSKATFALWQSMSPVNESDALVSFDAGRPCWFELISTNLDCDGKYHSELFSWTAKPSTVADMAYTEFYLGDKSIAGMFETTQDMKDKHVPPHWMTYFSVENADQTGEKALSLGGNILTPPQDIPGVGRICGIQDSTGGTFSVISGLNT